MGYSIIYVIRISPLLLTGRAPQTQTGVPPTKQDSNGHGSPPEQSPLTSLPGRSAWLFQSNPALYDLRGALVSLREQVWSVSRYAKEISIGDRVYLWEAGRQGGIAGVAEITEPPRVQPEPPVQHPFARVPQAFAGERPRTRLGILSVIDPVISRQSIVCSPELCGLGVLRCSRGTNFRLTVDQWQALNSLIVGATY
jgi:hypothetical protein